MLKKKIGSVVNGILGIVQKCLNYFFIKDKLVISIKNI